MGAVRVSIVIPTYNSKRYIEDAIGDILAQTFPEFELLVVDDGSTDGTIEVLRYYESADDRIKVLSQSHLGAGAARNLGIQEAIGEYVLFLDSDDRFDKRLLELAVAKADEENTDVLLYDASCVDGQTGTEQDSSFICKKHLIPQDRVFSWRDCAEWMLDVCYAVVWTKLYRAKFIREKGISFQNTPYMNDAYFHHIALLEAERILFLDAKLVEYRQLNEGSITGSERWMKHPMVVIEVMQSVRDYLVGTKKYEACEHGFLANAFQYLIGNLQDLYEDAGIFFKMYPKYKHYLLNELHAERLLEWLPGGDWRIERLETLCKSDAAEYVFHFFRAYRSYAWWTEMENRRLNEQLNGIGRELRHLIEHKHWVFDSSQLQEGERVVIYGAGEVGTDYHDQLRRENRVEIVGWIDRRAEDFPASKGVESIDILQSREFDKLIIAVRDKAAVQQIRKDIKKYLLEYRVLLMSENE